MLTQRQKDRLLELFERAVSLPSAQRAVFLGGLAGEDPDVLVELRSLLDVERAGLGSFLSDLSMGDSVAAEVLGAGEEPYDSEEWMTPQPASDEPAGNAGDPAAADGARRDLLRQRRYQLSGEISRGGMGVILRGQDSEFERPVAIKVMRREFRESPYLMHRFVEEARINGQLQHPGIVPVYDMGLRGDELPYFAMKLIEGRTLAALLEERPDPIGMLNVFEQICHAVGYAHSRGVVHRDLKPQNVMVGEFGEVHVLDWGVARVVEGGRYQRDRLEAVADDEREQMLSRCGTVVGTLPYMPPEQARGERAALGPQADVFALGAMVCELLTGRPAYAGTREEVFEQARAGDVGDAFAALDRSGADPELVALAKACLSPDQSERPADGAAVAARIRAYLRSIEERRRRAEIASAEAQASAAQERRARRLTVTLGGLVAAVLVTGVFAWSWWNAERSERRTRWATRVDAGVDAADLAFADGDFEQVLWRLDDTDALRALPDAAPDLAAEVAERMGVLRDGARKALANQKLLLDLEEVRMPERRAPGAADYRPTDWVLVDRAYHERFVAWGLDVDAGDEADAAEHLRDAGDVAAIAPVLDEWSVWRTRGGDLPGAARLRRIAGLVDTDAHRAALRAALENGDTAALVAAAAAGGDAVGTDADSTSTRMLLAHALHLGGRRDLGIEVLREGCRRFPGDYSLHMNLARALMLGAPVGAAEASRHYSAAAALRPDNQEARHELARTLHMFLGDDQRAEAILRGMLEVEPEDAHLQYHLGYVVENLGRHEEALAILKGSLRQRAEDSGSYNTMASAYLELRRVNEAIDAYRKAIELDPETGYYHANLGLALTRLGKLDDAREALERAVVLDPHDGDAHSSLGIVAYRQNRHADAVTCFRRAIAIDDSVPEYHTNLGLALGWTGPFDEAFEAYHRALELDPQFGDAWFNLGNLHYNLGDVDEAARAWWRCIEAVPGHENATAALCNVYWGKDWGKVAEAYAIGVEAQPQNAEFHQYLGVSRLELGEHGAAIHALERAIELDERRADAYGVLSRALLETGRFEPAAASAERGVAVSGDDAQRARLQGWVRRANQELERSRPLEPIVLGESDEGDRATLLAAAHVCFLRSSFARCAELHELARAADGDAIEALSPAQVEAIRAAARVASDPESRAPIRLWLAALCDAIEEAARHPDDAAQNERATAALRALDADAAVGSLREPGFTEALPEGERAAWAALLARWQALRES